MTTLADKSLLSGGDNKPPMLEKHLYDSWKSIMELYMINRPHGRMILASVEKGPLVWPSIAVEGVTRLKEYTKLTPAEAIQADCDIKAINNILSSPVKKPIQADIVPEKGDDPIDAINHMMSFLTAVVTSRYPTTNTLYEKLVNLCKQATINNGRVTLQPIQGRQTSFAAGTSRTYTPGASGSNFGKQRTVICYNCKAGSHIPDRCTKPKRKGDESGFKEKVFAGTSSSTWSNSNRRKLAFFGKPDIHKGQSHIDFNTHKAGLSSRDLMHIKL
ncbi:hypothetical protein Tco_0180728 [Tanacetum coccineum]